MAKSKHSRKVPELVSKKQNAIWSWLSKEAHQLYPSNDQTYERLAYSLCTYFQNDPEAIYLKQFFHEYGIGHKYFLELVAKSPLLADALEIAKEIIYIKRLKKLASNDIKFLKWDLHTYSDEVRANDEYHASMKAMSKDEQRIEVGSFEKKKLAYIDAADEDRPRDQD